MVLLGSHYWRHTLPAEQLLLALAGDKPWARMITVVDEPEEAAAFVRAHPPVPG